VAELPRWVKSPVARIRLLAAKISFCRFDGAMSKKNGNAASTPQCCFSLAMARHRGTLAENPIRFNETNVKLVW
jgi:hypothetical protein